jgi:FlaG/FlaF family flagellin (archaellin)
MKGVSAVIVTILLLLISISLASFGYLFFTQTFSSVTETGSEAVEHMTTNLLAGMKIDSAIEGNDYFNVRNTGKVDVSGFAVYVNDVIDNSASADKDPLPPGEVATITLSSNLNADDIVKVTSSEGSIAIKSI